MISWKTHKAAFTGASNYLIKGIISVVHSVTSASVIVTPDCFESFEGKIDDSDTVLQSSIDAAVTVLESNIEEFTPFSSIIEIQNNFQGVIDAAALALSGIIDDTPEAIEGPICI